MANNKQPFEWHNKYYGLNIQLGKDVIREGRKGTVNKDLGNYVGVIMHDDKNFETLIVHPMELTYLDTFTDTRTLRCKNWRAKQRYQDYREALEWYDGSFFDYLRDEKLIKSGKYFDL